MSLARTLRLSSMATSKVAIPSVVGAGRAYSSLPTPQASSNGIRHTDNANVRNILVNLESTWETMPQTEKIEVNKILEEVQKGDWRQMTVEQKQAAYYVAFGEYGARRKKSSVYETKVVFMMILGGVFTAAIGWNGFRIMAPPPGKTSTIEYQRSMNDYMKEKGHNPISGISSEGYKGKGMIQ
ncbi:Cytochrome c oxidase, subunit IV/COX5b [Phaffia rhodozyma]|uniref:Cytochrome c oxidase, subunit IV/COX5b n=1 Tax=Phaffia rhodozyma TaxID=264483 RepID=A0A0F7SIN0_PHARH|nr:Cytochrome c oxidase, subunit IV/COX5b [Phaffia rhodozyma]